MFIIITYRLVPICFQQNENNALCVSHPQTPLLLPLMANLLIHRYENMLILVTILHVKVKAMRF